MESKATSMPMDIENGCTKKLEGKIEAAIKALESIRILGDADWKSQKAREAIFDLKSR